MISPDHNPRDVPRDDGTRDLLRDTATRLFQDVCQPAMLRDAESGVWPRAAWQAIEEAGLPRALVPEAAGGHGVAFADAMVIVRAAGRFALPLPLPETMLAGWLLARAGLPVPEGPMTVALGGDIDASGRLSGQAVRVPWANAETTIVVVEGSGRVAVAPREICSVESGRNVAGEPRDTLRFAGLVTAGVSGLDATELRGLGAAMRAHQIAGALQRVTEMTVQYALDRTQFGRPIGKFQAVQQNLAILAGQTAAAIAAADMAGEAVSGDRIRLAPIAAGKARAGEAAGIGAAIAHQVHGAIGFTQEHGLHHLTKRLWSWRDEFGNETVWNRWLGRHMAAAGADQYWAWLTAA